jgi:hypothetical protein
MLAANAAVLTGSLYNGEWPPARFQADRRHIDVAFLSGPALAAVCGTPKLPGAYYFGCSNGGWIAIENPCQQQASDRYARELCHELGHLNGWPANHPH